MSPAIRLAKNGFRLTEQGANILQNGKGAVLKSAEGRKIFTKQGKLLKKGQLLKQPLLAKSLLAISKQGDKVFYHGWIAKAIAEDSRVHHGVLTQRDLANYAIEIKQPLTCHYHAYTILTTPPPGSGITVCEILSIVNHYPIASYGFNSAKTTHVNVEAFRYAYADRNHYLGDPKFVNNPVQRLLSAKYIDSIVNKIKPNKSGNSKKLGTIINTNHEKMNTVDYSVIDKWGNAVSVTYTLHGFFGSSFMPKGTGFFLNNELNDFTLKAGVPNMFQLVQGKTNLIAANKRPLSSMSPSIVLKDGKVFMVVGAAGGSTIITSVVQSIENVIDFHMNINKAINSPKYHMQWMPDVVFYEPGAFTAKTIRILQHMGYHFKKGFYSGGNADTWGQVSAIRCSINTHVCYGANDNRYPAGAAVSIRW